MPEGSRRAVVLGAMTAALLGATAIMVSPLTSRTAVLVLCGIALLLPSLVVLVVWLLRKW
jgi:uncharacterized membrane protein HdeD (DUF308 family)